jgi:multidrug efflux system membrane fusion protein
MGKYIAAAASLAVLILIIWGMRNFENSPHNATPALDSAVPVRVATAELRDVSDSATTIGTVQAYNTVLVRPRVDGQLERVTFVEGQDVRRGDVLAQIDPRPLEAQLHAALAQRDKDAAQLANAEHDLERFADLAHRGAISAQTLDSNRAQVNQLKAAIKADEAQIDNARIQLEYATIRAPLDGRTGARLIDAGNMVHASDNNGLVTITQIHPIFVTFSLPQDKLSALVAGQSQSALRVIALSRDSNEQLAAGELSLIDNQIDAASGTIRCKATFDNASGQLWPGQFVTARIVLGVRHNAVTIPAAAVQSGSDGANAFVISEKNIAELRHVEIARADDDRDVVIRGLSAGERVVTEGQYKIESGTRVRILDTGAAPK